MGILERLRPQPRWKHADPTVRAAAVYDLGPDEGDVLRALAREDAEARVRRAAVARLDDVAVLGDIARTDPDADVRAEAVRQLTGLAAEARDPVKAADIARQLVEGGRLKEVVVDRPRERHPDVRAAVVDLLDDPEVARRRSAGTRATAPRGRARWRG